MTKKILKMLKGMECPINEGHGGFTEDYQNGWITAMGIAIDNVEAMLKEERKDDSQSFEL